MSYQGQSPKVNRLRLQPRSADPINPAEGDLQYADGTVRDEGLYVYKNGAWTSIVDAQGSAIKIRFVPQPADPASPQVGDVFYADGTSRDKGLWVYKASGWQKVDNTNSQVFQWQPVITVKAATTAAISLSSTFAGSSINGVPLVNGDLILVKDNSTPSDNGIWVINNSPTAPTRYSGADTAAELSYAQVFVSAYLPSPYVGTAFTSNSNTIWYQQNALSTLSDTQSWTTNPSVARTFTVPDGVTALNVYAVAGGGGGGGGGGAYNGSGSYGGGGGAGGRGSIPTNIKVPVTPGETISIQIARGGPGGTAGVNISGGAGSAGGNTIISSSAGSFGTITVYGASGGALGAGNTGAYGVGANTELSSYGLVNIGSGTAGGLSAPLGRNSSAGNSSIFGSGGAASTGNVSQEGGGAGGGGGAGVGNGGAGAIGGWPSGGPTDPEGHAGGRGLGYGSGGGGGSGAYRSTYTLTGGPGGPGAPGYVRLSW